MPLAAAVIAVAGSLAVLGAPADAWAAQHTAASSPDQGSPNAPILKSQVEFRVSPDDCFKYIGGPSPDIAPGQPCPAGYQPRTNQAYMWSAVRSGDYAYFGTGANPVCTGAGGIYGATEPFATRDDVCEFAEGEGAPTYGPALGDTRPPQVFRYNADTGRTVNITPDDPRLATVVGLRGGFGNNNVVILAGQIPSGAKVVGLGMFAWEGSTGRYLGSQVFPDLSATRVGAVGSDGNLYIAARTAYNLTANPPQLPKGVILRWTGSVANPFSFETVGVLPNEAFYITTYKNRLAVDTSPFQFGSGGYYGLGSQGNGPGGTWLSPPLPPGGLTPADAGSWKEIFNYADFDPDPVVGQTISMGALAEFDGQLLVGTYQLDTAAGAAETLWRTYGTPPTPAGRLLTARQALRSDQVFAIANPGQPSQHITMLYGDYRWPVYNPVTKTWTRQPNKMGLHPTLGQAGYGNAFNEYCWTWLVFGGKLYMGTFDDSGMIGGLAPLIQQIYDTPTSYTRLFEKVLGPFARRRWGGADVWRLDSLSKPAVPETLNGFGDRSQYGIRVALAFPDKGFFLFGTAGADNLESPTGNSPPGGEIIKLTPQNHPVGPVSPPPSNILNPGLGTAAVAPAW